LIGLLKQNWRSVLVAALLGAVTAAAFWPVLRNQFLSYDDAVYISENAHVTTGLSVENTKWAFQTGSQSNWHPLTWLSHMLDVQLFGLNPARHHLVSLIFHLTNSVLLFLLLRRLTGAEGRSAIVAALFALHPLHVESVAWAAERKDVLSMFFLILTVWAYARFTRAVAGNSGSKLAPASARGWPWYFLALVMYALGLMSKPMLVTLPFLLLLLDLWPLGRLFAAGPVPGRAPILSLIWEKIPFFGLALVSSVVTFEVQQRGHSVSTTEGLPLGPRLENAITSYLQYLNKTIWPVDLAIFYPHPGLRGAAGMPPEWQVGLAALVLAGISFSAIRRARREPWFATGWFWFLGSLVPVLGLVQVGGQSMADRYSYIPLVGIFICAVWAFAEIWAGRRFAPVIQTAAGALALGACAVLTHKQVQYWHDDLSVFQHALAVTQNNPVAHNVVGIALARQGNFESALTHFRAAVEAYPQYPDGYCGLGATLANLGKIEEAVQNYETALQLNPNYPMAHNNLGACLWRLGNREQALAHYAEALRLAPNFADAHLNLGRALLADGNFPGAVEHLSQAARLNPGDPLISPALAQAWLKEGKFAEAEACLRDGIRLRPADALAHLNLAELLVLAGRKDEALQEYAEVVHLQPGSPGVQFSMADLLLGQGKFEEAATHFSEAVRLQKDFPEAFAGLGRALALQGKFGSAETQFREALRFSPTNVEWQVTLASTLMMTGKTNDAKAAYARALQLDPRLVEHNIQAGKTFAAQGQFEAALARFSTAVELNPDNAEGQENLGLTLGQLSKVDEAIPHFQKLIELRPDAEAYHHLALARLMQGNPKEAISNYERALKLKPDWAAAMNDLAWTLATDSHTEVRNAPEAVRLAEHACQLVDGKEARYLGTLDAAYAAAGRFPEAIATAEKARALAQVAGDKVVAQAAEARLALYVKGQPFVQ
jgi:tetratricopeptide (TPR) repeat protein